MDESGTHDPRIIRRSDRNIIPKKVYPIGDYTNFTCAFLMKAIAESVLDKSKEAMNSEKWNKAMGEEIKAPEDNNTWTIINLPENQKAVGCK